MGDFLVVVGAVVFVGLGVLGWAYGHVLRITRETK